MRCRSAAIRLSVAIPRLLWERASHTLLYPLDYPGQVPDNVQRLYHVESCLACGAAILSAVILDTKMPPAERTERLQDVGEVLREACQRGLALQSELHTALILARCGHKVGEVEFRDFLYPHALAACLDAAEQA